MSLIMANSSFNSSPINRIPNEIFRKVIQFAYTPEPKRTEKLALYLPSLSPPMNASHVCRSWRDTLLSDPTMWANLQIPKFKSAGIKEFIRRSKSTLLEVSISVKLELELEDDFTPSVTPALLSVIFKQIHRFKVLQVDIEVFRTTFKFYSDDEDDSSDSFDDMQGLVYKLLTYLERPAPVLQKFSFRYYNEDIDLESTFIKTLFHGHAPNLKHIRHEFSDDLPEIERCPLFRNLSELFISFPHCFALDFKHFLDLLELSPCLMLLCVDASWDLTCMSNSSFDRVVDLPHLQWLVLNMKFSVDLLDMILKHVKFGKNVKWNITSPHINSSVENREENAQKPGSSYLNSEPKREVMQILRKAHFTFLDILVSINDDYLELTLAETDGSGSRMNEPHGNTFAYVYKGVSELESHWDSIMESIDPSGISRLHFVFSTHDLSKTKISELENEELLNSIKHLSSRLVLLTKSLPDAKSYTSSFWIRAADKYCDFETDVSLEKGRQPSALHD